MQKKNIKKLIIISVLIMSALILMQLLYCANLYLERRVNHNEVEELISKDLLYSWDTMDDDLAHIQNMIDTKRFTNADLGRLYERASLIYLQKNETMSYYRYLGYALYYLERSDDKDYTVNIYLDLCNFFLNNYTEESAMNMLNEAKRVEPFEEIESIQIKSYAYRMLGIVSILTKDYDAAEKYLLESQDIVSQSHTNTYEESYQAINDTWLARVYVETGRYNECERLLAKWDGNDMFYADVYRQIMLRDLIVPYYQTKCYLTAAECFKDPESLTPHDRIAKEEEIAEGLQLFMTLCEENGYEKAELNTILRIQKEYPPTSEEIRTTLYDVLNRLYTKLFDYQNITYANVINNTVNDSKAEMAKNEDLDNQLVKQIELVIVSLIIASLIILLFVTLLLNSRLDGLTGVFNRRSFNRHIAGIKRRRQPYSIIMVDVDDFKHVNDTYGHPNGDLVLSHLGTLLRKEASPEIRCYRYGGEEFVLTLQKSAIYYAPKVAERLRLSMEQQAWPFDQDLVITISLGVATGKGTDEVVKEADANLYISKSEGKNRVTV